MKRTIQILLIFFTAFFGLLLCPTKASAAELNNTNFIDSIHFSDTNLVQGQTTSLRVEFSSKDDIKVKAGDTITFLLPDELQGMTETDGSPRAVALGELGQALIYKDRVIATFNEKVNDLERVKGHFNFGIEATRTKNPNKTTITTNLNTTAIAQEITIQGDTGENEQPGVLPFFWKSGDMLGEKNTVRWFINANMNKEDLSGDIVLTDTHGAGQQLDTTSFNVIIDNSLGRFQLTGDEFVAQGYGSIEVHTDDSFVITINREHARLASFSFMYSTNITDNTIKSFTNTCDISYQPYGENAIQDQGSFDVVNLFADGDANGEKGIKEANEETLIDESEKLEEIDPIIPENITPTDTEDNTNNTAESHQIETNIDTSEETITDESEKLEEIDPIIPENITPTDTEDNTNNTAESHQIETNIDTSEETITDESEKLEEIDPIIPENITPTDTEDNTNNIAESHQIETNISPSEETITDESEMLEGIDPIIPENITPTDTEDNTNNIAESHQIETNIDTSEETITDESEKLEEIDPIVTEKITPTDIENNANNAVKINPIDINEVFNEKNPAKQKHTSLQTSTTVEIQNLSTGVPSQNVTVQQGKALPKTGDTKNYFLNILGLLLLSITSASFFLRRKNKI
jgi:LPXTG-motif cell wall-anchored protein